MASASLSCISLTRTDLPISEPITTMTSENILGKMKHTAETGLELSLRHKAETKTGVLNNWISIMNEKRKNGYCVKEKNSISPFFIANNTISQTKF